CFIFGITELSFQAVIRFLHNSNSLASSFIPNSNSIMFKNVSHNDVNTFVATENLETNSEKLPNCINCELYVWFFTSQYISVDIYIVYKLISFFMFSEFSPFHVCRAGSVNIFIKVVFPQPLAPKITE